jgi:hypothetical protein
VVLDFRKANRAELVAGACGVALIVFMLALHWYGVRSTNLVPGPDAPGGVAEGYPRDAFESFTFVDVCLLITALAAIALPLVKAASLPIASRIPLDLIVAALGVVAVILIAIRLIDPPDLVFNLPKGPHPRVSDFHGDEVIMKIGPWLGLVAAVGIAVGGWNGREERTPDAPARGQS